MFIGFALFCAFVGMFTHAAAEPLSLFVATNGNDAWSGKLSEPNADNTDGPFATLERARDAIRALNQASDAYTAG